MKKTARSGQAEIAGPRRRVVTCDGIRYVTNYRRHLSSMAPSCGKRYRTTAEVDAETWRRVSGALSTAMGEWKQRTGTTTKCLTSNPKVES